MKSIAIFLLERVFPRLFCGSECWDVEYELTVDPSQLSQPSPGEYGIAIQGTHRTYQALSKARSPEEGREAGRLVAKEIAQDLKMRSGIRGESLQIKNVKRNW